MTRLVIIAEGQTEQGFIDNVLRAHLPHIDIHVASLRGGRISTDTIVNDTKRLVYNYDYVTTLVDFYRFQNPRRQNSADELQEEMRQKLQGRGRERFIPYIQQYEFEALLFSDVNQIIALLGQGGKGIKKQEQTNPEDINHDEPPSKLLLRSYPDYQKILHGSEITKRIGLNKIRQACPRFGRWLDTLETLGTK